MLRVIEKIIVRNISDKKIIPENTSEIESVANRLKYLNQTD
jgi:hypothetical protein